MKKITRVHIAVNVKSMEKSMEFYCKLFNCKPNRVAHDQLDWIINEPPVHFSIYSSNKYNYGLEHIGVDMPPNSLKSLKYRLGTQEAQVYDPDGNKVELYTTELN